MQSDILDCPICYEAYDITIHLPRIIPVCGHTICSQCIMTLAKRSRDFVCPIGKEVQRGNYANLDSFPPNYTLRGLIEQSSAFEICRDHQKELQYMCVQDKVKVCHECALFGAHRSHEIKPLNDFKSEAETKVQKLEEVLQATGEYYKKADEALEKQQRMMLKAVGEKFNELNFLLKAKEKEFIMKINGAFKRERNELNNRFGPGSKLVTGLNSHIKEWKGQGSKGQSLINEDKLINNFDKSAWDISTGEVSKEFEENLKGILDCVEPLYGIVDQVQMPTMTVAKFVVAVIEEVVEEENLPMEEEEDWKKPIMKLQYKKGGMVIEGVSRDLEEFLCQNHIWGHSNELIVEINNESEITEESIKTLCYVKNKLKGLQTLRINSLEQKLVPDDVVIPVISALSGSFQGVVSFAMNMDTAQLSNEAILLISRQLINKASSLKRLTLFLKDSKVTDEGIHELADSINNLSENLDHFQLNLSGIKVSEDSLTCFFLNMPKVKRFALSLGCTTLTNGGLYLLSVSTLVNMAALESFEASFWDTNIGDEGVFNMLETLSNVKNLTLNLGSTKITDRALQNFSQKVLPKMDNLRKITFKLNNTKVSEKMKIDLNDASVKVIKRNEERTKNS